MSERPKPDSVLDDIRELLMDFGLPVIIICVCMVLILTGADGEVKAILALAAGWVFKSGYTKVKK
jgi:hypothetical protein